MKAGSIHFARGAQGQSGDGQQGRDRGHSPFLDDDCGAHRSSSRSAKLAQPTIRLPSLFTLTKHRGARSNALSTSTGQMRKARLIGTSDQRRSSAAPARIGSRSDCSRDRISGRPCGSCGLGRRSIPGFAIIEAGRGSGLMQNKTSGNKWSRVEEAGRCRSTSFTRSWRWQPT